MVKKKHNPLFEDEPVFSFSASVELTKKLKDMHNAAEIILLASHNQQWCKELGDEQKAVDIAKDIIERIKRLKGIIMPLPEIVLYSIELGQLFERLKRNGDIAFFREWINSHGRNLQAHRNSKAGAKKAAKLHSEKAAKERPDFQKLVEAEIKKLQKLKGHNRVYQEACRNVGEAKDYDTRTVMNHVPNTWTPKKQT